MHLSRTLLIDARPWEQSDVVVLHADLLGVLSWCCRITCELEIK